MNPARTVCLACLAACGLVVVMEGRAAAQFGGAGGFGAQAVGGIAIDTDGIVNVSARDTETGQQASTTITLTGGMRDAEINAASERNRSTALA